MTAMIVTPGGNQIAKQDTVIVSATRASTDDQLVTLFLNSVRSDHTRRAYAQSVEAFRQFISYMPLQLVTLEDAQAFMAHLAEKYPSANSQKLKLNTIKSLFSFATSVGYLRLNVFAAVKAPRVKDTLAERILSESEVLTMIALTTKERDKVLLRLLYASAGRVSEICGLCWRDVQPSGDSGQVTLFGKGGDTRAVKLSKETWKSLNSIRGVAAPDAPVFASQMGGAMVPSRVWQIVREAAQRAGIAGNVSPHWFRHSHASHALDRGASVALVRDTLGHSSLAVTSRYTHAKPDQSSALHLAV